MDSKRLGQHGFAYLELLLVVALLALICQAFPGLFFRFCVGMDFRNWSRAVWIAINIGTILILFTIRYCLELRAALVSICSTSMTPRQTAENTQHLNSVDEQNARTKRDAEWCERARNRLPFT
jgi:hypothetical protein